MMWDKTHTTSCGTFVQTNWQLESSPWLSHHRCQCRPAGALGEPGSRCWRRRCGPSSAWSSRLFHCPTHLQSCLCLQRTTRWNIQKEAVSKSFLNVFLNKKYAVFTQLSILIHEFRSRSEFNTSPGNLIKCRACRSSLFTETSRNYHILLGLDQYVIRCLIM